LEGLGFAANLVFLIQTLIGRRIDRGNGPGLLVVAAANVNTLGGGVVAQVVSSALKVYGCDEIEGASIVDIELAFSAGHEELISLRRKGNTLGIWHPGDGVFNDSSEYADHFHRVVAKRGDKYSALTGSEMIETPFRTIHGN